MNAYTRFFDHLKECGGCVGPRTLKQCHFAGMCAVVEAQKQKGLVRDSMDYGYPVGLDIVVDNTTELRGSGTAETYWPKRSPIRH